MNNQMKFPQMVECYVKIRDAKAAAKKAFDKETKRMTDALVKLDAEICAILTAAGAESVVTEFGTAYRKRRANCSVKDRDAFYKFAIDTGNLDAIDMKANAPAVRELLNQGIDVPGVNYTEIIQAGIRRK